MIRGNVFFLILTTRSFNNSWVFILTWNLNSCDVFISKVVTARSTVKREADSTHFPKKHQPFYIRFWYFFHQDQTCSVTNNTSDVFGLLFNKQNRRETSANSRRSRLLGIDCWLCWIHLQSCIRYQRYLLSSYDWVITNGDSADIHSRRENS
jgi:hypothetical protein